MADVLRPELRFRRSGRCTGGGCVEVALLPDGGAAVRASGNRVRRPLTFSRQEWLHFVSGVKSGEFSC
ncbi:MAG TPA: DUF397 domain-containing protein [Pseudonocardiaceae bacterium]